MSVALILKVNFVKVIQVPRFGDSIEATEGWYPSRLSVAGDTHESSDCTATTYGYVMSGEVTLVAEGVECRLETEGFFCIPGAFQAKSTGIVVLITRLGYRGPLAIGRLEKFGRLAYIAACSSTMLVPPPRKGDPVFNHLHIPNGVRQDSHTHPTVRLGIVARGHGIARGRDRSTGNGWQEPLVQGSVFLIEPHEIHSFHTDEAGLGLDLVTYHPDSECGPSDGVHPMLSRTFGAVQG